MFFLLIIFLNQNFALANDKIDDPFIKEESINKHTFKQVDADTIKDLHNITSEDITLKNIPRSKISEIEKNSIRDRNPFLPAGSDESNSKSVINFANIKIKGIAKIGDSKVVFMETSEGSNAYEIGQLIGGGYTVSKIDEDKLTIEITNQSVTHSLKFSEDEN